MGPPATISGLSVEWYPVSNMPRSVACAIRTAWSSDSFMPALISEAHSSNMPSTMREALLIVDISPASLTIRDPVNGSDEWRRPGAAFLSAIISG